MSRLGSIKIQYYRLLSAKQLGKKIVYSKMTIPFNQFLPVTLKYQVDG